MRTAKPVREIPVPVLKKKIDIYLPEERNGSEGWFEVGRRNEGEVEKYWAGWWGGGRLFMLLRTDDHWEI